MFLPIELVQTSVGTLPVSTAPSVVNSSWTLSTFITKEMGRSTVAGTMLRNSSLDVQLVMR